MSTRLDWSTPQGVFDELDKEFNFNWDVCADEKNAKCFYYFPGDRGLDCNWSGTCFMNPPFGREISKWIKKAHDEAKAGRATIVCLIPSRTDTSWWHSYVMKADEIRFIKGRLKFNGHKNSAPFPSAIVVFRPNSVGTQSLSE
ncbi:hypothetical protein LCGC14_0338160 [marine sediment metagenome]|uniref:Adenine methyltransferase n=1 Tax=marine sediment metagenome TaxID=412755 RepID=A0A0F9TXC7_9ZZZZ